MKIKGFTLIELLTALSLSAVLLGVGVPSFVDFINKQKISSASMTLIARLAMAREIAVTSGIPVSICPTDDGKNCSKSWGNQLLAYKDLNGNGKREEDDIETLYAVSFGGDWRLRWSAFGNKSQLTITPRGYTNHQNGSFYICPKSEKSKLGRLIVVNKAGRPRSAPDSDHNGFAEKPNGKNMQC